MPRWRPEGEVEVRSGHSLNPCIMASGSILWVGFSSGLVFFLRCLSNVLVWMSIGWLSMSAVPCSTCWANGLAHSSSISDRRGLMVNMVPFAWEK